MGKDALYSYLSPIADEEQGKFRDPRGLSMGSMDEKMRKINEEFKARACVGNGFVFNKNVKLESPASYFGKCTDPSDAKEPANGSLKGRKDVGDVNSLKSKDGFIGGVIPWKVNSSGAVGRGMDHRDVYRGSVVGLDLYKKPSIDFTSYTKQKGSGMNSKMGYVKSMASSSIFNRNSSFNYGSPAKERNTVSPCLYTKRKEQVDTNSSPSRSVFSNPLSNHKASSSSLKTSSQASNSFLCNNTSGSPAFAPIDVMYVKTPKPKDMAEDVECDSSEQPRARAGSCNTSMASNLYAPGRKLTICPNIKISNTVLCYENSRETTKYYITVESDVSWMICKPIGDIATLIPSIQCTTLSNAMSPQDRRARDRMIQVTLNSGITDKQLQSFILSDISSDQVFRSSYLLMYNEGWKAYLFKFVGKALICYEKSRVFKILLLSGCNVLPLGHTGFCLEKSGEGIELYTTCEKERDAWISDIKEYIGKL
ncbi:hypothetical protein EHEL_020580 [Encephalitozoon hellem ATCC 50504]|uniref:PH domain-containing protein n=1 Tax=Encephalitozoon hellem TaxID=27973 RepID=A0A9Q9C8V7_ENCHE|nr:uncharacterized protein EHEL_020580 [Encephalitozoon hellem ATCC 50504]AFM97814.1 hypothetical protein EHEL_020580 [Encephalitozoon hellem ATCC 50504]UTX42587.1 hypothetical protein GPU96_02g02990 [Encephalitozoon hellem]|eukprot:XP_003886795.1 hypothetical protein EHEL_020580 [Encephalitozoon hellem ATCC 50504]